MNLPELQQLRNNESTYISFSKGLLDLDKAISNDTEFYFSKVVAIQLPNWEKTSFFIDLSSVGIESENPNLCFPKAIQYYMENIIRQNITTENSETPVEEVVELAFWKLMRKMTQDVLEQDENKPEKYVKFVNDIVMSNFISTESNNGWGEIICQIPNRCRNLVVKTKTVQNVKDIVVTADEDTALYDNGNKEFTFEEIDKQVIDFNNCEFEEVEQSEFSFNALLLFYRDSTGVDKLHGINFIYPFENKVTYWDQITLTQKTNVTRNKGYQFIFNMKTCNNEASLTQIYNQNEHAMWWNGFEKTLSSLNSFLEVKMRESNTERDPVPDIDYID